MAQFESNRIYAVGGPALNALIRLIHEHDPSMDGLMELFAKEVISDTLNQHLCEALKGAINTKDPM